LNFNELIPEEKLKELNNNPYLIDFLKFLLVKDQNYRPNIDTIIKRFEHVHALLVGGNQQSNVLNNISKRFNINIDSALETLNELMSGNMNANQNISIKNVKLKNIPAIIKITEDIYLSDYLYVENNFDRIYKLGVTHVVSWTKTRNKELFEKMLYLNLLEFQTDMKKEVYHHIFKVMDFLRHCRIYQGILLFVDDFQYINMQIKPNFFIRNLLILVVSFILQLSAYDAWTYLNSKLLFFWIPPEDLTSLSLWVMNHSLVYNYIFSYPVVRCLCGGCVIILKRNYSNINSMNIKTCSCSIKQKNIDYSDCPSPGCYEYIQEIKVLLIN
jgi:hypothetical protein